MRQLKVRVDSDCVVLRNEQFAAAKIKLCPTDSTALINTDSESRSGFGPRKAQIVPKSKKKLFSNSGLQALSMEVSTSWTHNEKVENLWLTKIFKHMIFFKFQIHDPRH
jgi:hypothetical protein